MLKQLIEKLLCKHKWEVLDRIRIYKTYFDQTTDFPYKIIEVFVCQNCGKIKKIKI